MNINKGIKYLLIKVLKIIIKEIKPADRTSMMAPTIVKS